MIASKSRLAKTIWIGLFERANLEAAGAVHVTSEAERESLARLGFSLKRVAEIDNGLDVPDLVPGSSRVDGIAGPIVLALGRISWKKGLDRLVRAIGSCPGAQLVIAGPDDEGELPGLLRLAEECGVRARVHAVGPVHGDEKWRVLSVADLVVLPSRSENFGNVLLEAMGVGVPVVTTADVGLARAIAAAGAGVVVEGGGDNLGMVMSSLLADCEARERMGAAGRKLVREQFSWSVIGARYEALYRSLAVREQTAQPHA